jgi:hypothetical protein
MGQRDADEGLGNGGGLTDDLNLIIAVEELPDSFSDQLVIIEEEHPNAHAAILPAAQ